MLRQNHQSLLQKQTHRRLSGYLIYTDGWLWFGHVSVVLRLSNGWVKINYNFAYSQIDIIPLGWKWVEPDMDLQRFTVDIPYSQRRFGLGFFSCVEQVKSLLGIKAWWVITPKQLRGYIDGRRFTDNGVIPK